MDTEEWQAEVCSALGLRSLQPYQIVVVFRLLTALGLLPREPGSEDDPFKNFLALFPTGMGKTACFMGPIAVLQGFSLVIYPLNALLADQQMRFDQARVPCVRLQGGQKPSERDQMLDELRREGRGVILTNPETLLAGSLDNQLRQLDIQFMVVDEVHLVASWGTDFRPVFSQLGQFRQKLQIPVLAGFSATVTEEAEHYIRRILFLDQPVRSIQAPMDRPNLYFQVYRTRSPHFFAPMLFTGHSTLLGIPTLARPALVFCRTRAEVERVAGLISRFLAEQCDPFLSQLAGSVHYYHAGLSKAERARKEEVFRRSAESIMVCTCAYGTGVDKPNIRSVLHLSPPESPEDYIQEAGRGGRDRELARAMLLVDPRTDLPAWARTYTNGDLCRRESLLSFLADELEGCSGCDVCDGNKREEAIEERIVRWSRAFVGPRGRVEDSVRLLHGKIPYHKLWIPKRKRTPLKVLVRLCSELNARTIQEWFGSEDETKHS